MNKRILILTIVGWIILILFNYYHQYNMNSFMTPFFLGLEFLGLLLTFFIVFSVQAVKLIRERKTLSKLRIQYVLVFLTLFLLTLFRSTTNNVIEKTDWIILYNKREEIVEKVKKKELEQNVPFDKWRCKLPFDFPIVSIGNVIGIWRNEDNNKLTVTFWAYTDGFADAVSSNQFVYTDDPDEIKRIEEKIKNNPTDNWKINNNWYRTNK